MHIICNLLQLINIKDTNFGMDNTFSILLFIIYLEMFFILQQVIGDMVSGRYFNRGVKTLDNPDIGYVVRETPDKIVVFGYGNQRFDIPKSEILAVGRSFFILDYVKN